MTAIAASQYYSLALKDDGSVWSWGLNTYGDLGDGTLLDRPAPVKVQLPVPVTRIAAGRDHALALV